MKRTRGQAKHSFLSMILRIMVPIGGVLIALFIAEYNNLIKARQAANLFMQNTAEVLVEDIKTTINIVDEEVFYRDSDDRYFANMQKEIKIPNLNDETYKLMREITTENSIMNRRYGDAYNFFAYGVDADILFLDINTYFKGSFETPLAAEIRAKCKEFEKRGWCRSLLWLEEKPYLFSAYGDGISVHGYLVDLQQLLSGLKVSNMGYQIVPYIIWEQSDTVITATEEDRVEVENYIVTEKEGKGQLKDMNCSFAINNAFSIEMLLIPDEGILEGIVEMQITLLLITAALIIALSFGCCYLYLKLIQPTRQFVETLRDPEVELFLDNTGTFNVLELEQVSAEFKEILRRIRTLKIAIYEKDLMAKQVQVEYAQEQMQSHFYLNCLSILHGMAERNNDNRMTDFLERLSRYVSYVNNESDTAKTIREELGHIRDYVEIQRFRYKDAFVYATQVDERLLEYKIPTLLLQSFVENAIKHGLTFRERVEISLFITTEMLDGEEYLYISISDTGKGFSEEILKAIEQEEPIWYDNRKHVGIANVKQRIKLFYGDRAKINLFNMARDYGAVVELVLPLLKEEIIEEMESFQGGGKKCEGIDRG